MAGQSVQSPGYKTFIAYEDLVAHRRVGFHSGASTVEYVDAGAQCIGMTLSDAKAGEPIAVEFMHSDGSFWGVAADSFAVDATLYAANDGKISDTSSGTAIGKALEAASNSGDIVEWIPFPVISTTAAANSIADAGSFTAQTTVEAALQEIYQHIETTKGMVNLPMPNITDAGVALAAFADGASSVPGFCVTAKGLGIRWNNHATPGAVGTKVIVPPDADITANMTLHILAAKTGATVGDATKFTVAAYNNVVATLYDADANFGGDTGAMTGDATAKTIQEVTLTLALANLAAYPAAVELTIQPKAATLGTDDVIMLAAWIEYKRKLLTA